jgi:hypothetical protein
MKDKVLISNFWLVVHAALAVGASQMPAFSMLWAVGTLFIAMFFIVNKKNRHQEAAKWAAYMAGLEVVLRGTGGAIVWEFGKYSVIVILLLGLSTYQYNKLLVPKWIILIAILIIPSVFMTFSWSDTPWIDISPNISGLICLLVSTYYFSIVPISEDEINNVFKYFILPAISLSVVLFYRTPDLDTIAFDSRANFETSGGFGPNQVASILGLACLLLIVLINKSVKVTSFKSLSFAIFVFVLFRSLFTFSRGGNIAAVLAYVVFVYVYVKAKDRTIVSAKYVTRLIVLIISVVMIVVALNSITGGVFSNRYMGQTAEGLQKEDITSGRSDIMKEEWILFKENPLGVGIGGSKHFRAIRFGGQPVATHNEFTRLLSEEGVFGLIILLTILFMPYKSYKRQPNLYAKAICAFMFIISIATAMHSSFRIAMPAYFYGFCFLNIKNRFI